MGTTVELRLPGPLTHEVVAGTCEQLRVRLSAGGVSRVVCHLDGGEIDLTAVDALARLALTARRAGAGFGVGTSDAALLRLLRLVGLSDVLLEAAEG